MRWIVVIGILLLSLTDGIFTLYFTNLGIEELNPVMDYFIKNMGNWSLLPKMLLTVFGCAVMVWLWSKFLLVRVVSYLLFSLYVLVVVLHIYLWRFI